MPPRKKAAEAEAHARASVSVKHEARSLAARARGTQSRAGAMRGAARAPRRAGTCAGCAPRPFCVDTTRLPPVPTVTIVGVRAREARAHANRRADRARVPPHVPKSRALHEKARAPQTNSLCPAQRALVVRAVGISTLPPSLRALDPSRTHLSSALYLVSYITSKNHTLAAPQRRPTVTRPACFRGLLANARQPRADTHTLIHTLQTLHPATSKSAHFLTSTKNRTKHNDRAHAHSPCSLTIQVFR